MADNLIKGFLGGLKPVDILTVSEWADKYRHLSGKAAAQPGPWRTSKVPYLRKIQDSLTTGNGIEKVIVMKGAQLGLTEAGNNWVGYIIHNNPGPTLMVMPTAETMKRNSEIRIDPMIEATPVLQEKIKPARSKDSGNKMMQKEFPGGILMMAGANSAAGLRSMPVRNLFLDEVDGYPPNIEGEGSPIALAEARTRTFDDSKVYEISTPTEAGASIIESDFALTDKQYYFVPCPHCGSYQKLIWAQIKWDKTLPAKQQPHSAYYECIDCGDAIREHHKERMLANGEWRVTAPENVSVEVVGFHINSLYSPFYAWRKIVELWQKAQGKTELLISFVNTILGEVWVGEGEAPDWERLYDRREEFDGEAQVPLAVGVITAGVDVQKDRLECEVVGWGAGNESWSLGYWVLMGDTAATDVWEDLGVLLGHTFTRADGQEMGINSMAVDTGYNTQQVYTFAKRYPASRVIPVKGQDAQRVAISAPQAVRRRVSGKRVAGARLVNIGVSVIKAELYGWLRLGRTGAGALPPGYCHFPRRYDEHYFKMLTAEKYVFVADKKGFGKYEWVKKFERNEALDVRVYARAAAHAIGIEGLKAADWKRLAGTATEAAVEGEVAEAISGLVEAPEAKPAPVSTVRPSAKSVPARTPKKRQSIWGGRG